MYVLKYININLNVFININILGGDVKEFSEMKIVESSVNSKINDYANLTYLN